jgi:hypothetical protein
MLVATAFFEVGGYTLQTSYHMIDMSRDPQRHGYEPRLNEFAIRLLAISEFVLLQVDFGKMATLVR